MEETFELLGCLNARLAAFARKHHRLPCADPDDIGQFFSEFLPPGWRWKDAPAGDCSANPMGEEWLMWQAYYLWQGRRVVVVEYQCCGRGDRVVAAVFCESDAARHPLIRAKSPVLRLRRRLKREA